MKRESEWNREVHTLAREWQPAIAQRVIDFYVRCKIRMPARLAFAETYERFFLNPTKEDIND